MAGPASPETLRVYLGIDPATAVDTEAMTAACDAANDLVAELRPDLVLDDLGVPLTEWPPRAAQAAVVEAAMIYGGRGSVLGAAAFADVGVAYIPATHPKFRELLELGDYQKSVVA